MVAKMGQDGHDRGAKVVATGYAAVSYTHLDVYKRQIFNTTMPTANRFNVIPPFLKEEKTDGPT